MHAGKRAQQAWRVKRMVNTASYAQDSTFASGSTFVQRRSGGGESSARRDIARDYTQALSQFVGFLSCPS
ncbi:hypothetical protein QQF64_014417 [Cirrhinus molitorella]|uniref:Uncharacterized protein n=1 Tax=Cirrhinus molitorella TaxID=172907 RepID=A0ABR3NSJ2_9TELE